jgi:hypothetical protein
LTAPPVWFHELVVGPVAFAAALVQAGRALGWRRAAGELLVLTVYGYALEAVAIRVFASHTYGASWAVAPLGVPLAVALVWAAVISSAMAHAARMGLPSLGARAAVAALVAVSLDLLMEPVAMRVGLWRWTPPGPWLGVPIGNFVGWAIIVAGYSYGAERFARDGAVVPEALRRLAVAAVSVLALVLVGLAWRGLRVEHLFTASRGWIAWAAILAAVVATARSPADGVRGTGPAAVLLGLAAVFVIDAATLGDPRLWLAALGPAASLLWVSGRASSGSSAPSPAATASPAPPVPGGAAG